jgi:glyoxylase-like metal-dependent hydrolase (beta-lactamase superfamily II)
MARMASRPRTIDLHFQQRPRSIATGVVETPDGVLLVDPGPASCLGPLERGLAELGIAPRDVRGLLLTHIHLDHAGASGTIAGRFPDVTVYVHERGAPHLADPSKLLASARRLYGDQMDRLWGEFVPVPADRLRVLVDGETIRFGGVAIDVAYTLGHASHHAAFFDRASGMVFAGDTGGIRVGPSLYVLPPTPPPDIDIPAWHESIGRMRRWEPEGVFVTHFGAYDDGAAHLGALASELDAWLALTDELMTRGTAPEDRLTRFIATVRARIAARVTPAEAEAFRHAMSLDDCWTGLERFWTRRVASDAARRQAGGTGGA